MRDRQLSEATTARGIRARVAILTPISRGAIAVIQLWGLEALGIADAVFRPIKRPSLSMSRPGVLRLGRIGEGLGDEVVAVVRKAGSDRPPSKIVRSVEFQCHGGSAAWELVINALLEAGATRSDPREWIREEGAASPIRTAAREDLALASTSRTAEILLDQVHGALDREIQSLISYLNEDSTSSKVASRFVLDELLRRAEFGVRLIRGWRIVLAGRPNVGKSSLMNALAGFTRSIVDATPGTTRDNVTLNLSIEGWPVFLSDTAGLHRSADALEVMGMTRARRAHQEADIVLAVLDRSRNLVQEDRELIRCGNERGWPVIANKSDLDPAWNPDDLSNDAYRVIEVSSRNLTGIDSLLTAIGGRLVPEHPAEGAGVPFREAHLNMLREASRALASGDGDDAVAWLIRLLMTDDVDRMAHAFEG